MKTIFLFSLSKTSQCLFRELLHYRKCHSFFKRERRPIGQILKTLKCSIFYAHARMIMSHDSLKSSSYATSPTLSYVHWKNNFKNKYKAPIFGLNFTNLFKLYLIIFHILQHFNILAEF